MLTHDVSVYGAGRRLHQLASLPDWLDVRLRAVASPAILESTAAEARYLAPSRATDCALLTHIVDEFTTTCSRPIILVPPLHVVARAALRELLKMLDGGHDIRLALPIEMITSFIPTGPTTAHEALSASAVHALASPLASPTPYLVSRAALVAAVLPRPLAATLAIELSTGSVQSPGVGLYVREFDATVHLNVTPQRSAPLRIRSGALSINCPGFSADTPSLLAGAVDRALSKRRARDDTAVAYLRVLAACPAPPVAVSTTGAP